MKHFLLFLLICTCLTVHSQNNFADIQGEVATWYQNIIFPTAIKSKNPKSIDFHTHHYSIYGIIDKGRLSEGTIAKFYDTSALAPQLLLEGKVNYVGGRMVIEGVRYLKTPTDTNKLYGTFYVYNMDDFTMNYKPKKAGSLKIIRDNILYLEGSYSDRKAIIRITDVNTIYLDRKKEGSSFSFLSAEIPNIFINDDDSFDIHQILLQANDGVTICWEDGTMFKGRVKPTPAEGSICFISLDGQRTSPAQRITLSHENGNIVFSQDYNDAEKLLSNETLLIKDDGTISEEDYWKLEKLLEHCYLTKWTYRNGNYFEGSIKVAIKHNEGSCALTIQKTITNGVFKYPNGDRFEGDVTQPLGPSPFFVGGITYFKDGSKETGNWLKKFKLTVNQRDSVLNCSNPSDARELARQLVYRNNYPEYEYDEVLEYFDPSEEQETRIFNPYLTYNKAKNRYINKSRYSKETILEFAIDNNGYRKWEIVYDNGKPKYINQFTWYSNGVIETIKSYSYDTKKLYLSCYFFSDGKLRSAYQYGKSNNGKNVIRKSKESNPTYGGYTCKLYDLNGNYERSIEWRIGVGESFWGTIYDKKMAPAHIIVSKLKPINM